MRHVVLALVLLGSVAAADDRPSLRLDREPAPRHLRMRRKKLAVAAPPAAPPAVTPPEAMNPTAFKPSEDAIGLVRDLRRPISARFAMGYVVDGAPLSGANTLDGRPVDTGDGLVTKREGFRRLRAYAIGEGTFSSRGVVLPSLSTYFAGGFQIAKPQLELDPGRGERAISPPVATWFDRTGFQGRSAWLEVKDFLEDKRYAPLRVRAGQLYVYGPWVLHMYGGLLAWDGKLTKFTLYAGSRVPDYTLVQVLGKDRSGIFGGSARFDLRALKAKIPFAFGVEFLQFTARGSEADTASGHLLTQIDWRPREDFALIASARALDGRFVNEKVQLRSRYKEVTNLVFDLGYRDDKDWRWDPSVTNNDPLQARRYLDLGPVVPQLTASGRAGTLVQENVDVLVRGAVADDRVDRNEQRSTFAARYWEVGGGFEVRLRRTVGLGVSGLTRRTKRLAIVDSQIGDVPGEIQPLPRDYSPDIGETSFFEIGSTLRMSLGARRFSALVEWYGRRTKYALTYCDQPDPLQACRSALDTGIEYDMFRWGGRVTVDAWIGARLRLFASYELSSAIDLAPEITGFKSLRLLMEGAY